MNMLRVPSGLATGDRWEPFLAGLPHLLFGLLVIGGSALASASVLDARIAAGLLVTAFGILITGGLVYALRARAVRWWGSWYFYLFFVTAVITATVVQFVGDALIESDNWFYPVPVVLGLLALAYVLYKAACADRWQGLLAALMPTAAIFWLPYEEFVPPLFIGLAWAWACLVAFAVSALILRAGRFEWAVGLALLAPVLTGLPFVYLGVYYGGALPYSQPGPSLGEVLRQFLPLLPLVSCLVLGPQLGRMLRAVGRESREEGGTFAARLALLGLLLAFLTGLLRWLVYSDDYLHWMRALILARGAGFLAAPLLFAGGFLLLIRAGLRSGALLVDRRAGPLAAALFVLLPGAPLLVYLAVDMPLLGGQPSPWWITALGLAWMVAAGLVTALGGEVGQK